MCLLAMYMSSLGKYLVPVFDWIVCFSGIELHELIDILEMNSLSVVSFAIIFSHFRVIFSHCL